MSGMSPVVLDDATALQQRETWAGRSTGGSDVTRSIRFLFELLSPSTVSADPILLHAVALWWTARSFRQPGPSSWLAAAAVPYPRATIQRQRGVPSAQPACTHSGSLCARQAAPISNALASCLPFPRADGSGGERCLKIRR
jgi:hypothetical protein